MSDDAHVQLSNSVISLDGLATPVTKFIEKLSDGIGVLYRPHQIKNLAEAEVEAAKIKVRGTQATEGFLEYCVEHWQRQGCRPASPFPH